MNQKEFKKYVIAELDKALQSAQPFSKTDLIEIESLRSQINYQLRKLSCEPNYKTADELKEYRKEILEQIAELKSKIDSIYRVYGWIVIQFPNGKRQYRLVNARQEIERIKSKVRGLTDGSKSVAKKYVIRNEQPKAHKDEIFEGIVPIANEGWFTDGHVLVKGEAPANAEIQNRGKQPFEIEWMLKLEGSPAKRLYFFFEHISVDRQYVSDNPLPTFFHKNGSKKDSIDSSVLFECDGRFWCYNQNKYNFIANRHPDVDRYEIVFDQYHFGYLKFFVDDEIVGLMTPYRPIGSESGYFAEQPPLKEMAIRSGLYQEAKKE